MMKPFLWGRDWKVVLNNTMEVLEDSQYFGQVIGQLQEIQKYR